MDPVVLASARKHGIADDDMLDTRATRSASTSSTTSRCSSAPAKQHRSSRSESRPLKGVEFILRGMPAQSKFLE